MANIFDSEIIHHECEPDWSPFVHPQAWDQLALEVAMLVEAFLKELISDEAGVGKSIHSEHDHDIYPVICIDKVKQFVFLDDFLWDGCP